MRISSKFETITAYKFSDGTIVQDLEEAKKLSKEIDIWSELYHEFTDDKAEFTLNNIDLIKNILK